MSTLPEGRTTNTSTPWWGRPAGWTCGPSTPDRGPTSSPLGRPRAGARPGMGSTGPADAATESFMRYLAAEVGQFGVRVCGIGTAGIVATLTKAKLAEMGGPDVPEPHPVGEMSTGMAALRRTPTLADGITGSMTNVTRGLVLR
jgi:NAD(P)-dependent dehydrogenase (short-subunit alcohol dehydrogenase family)